MVVGTVNLFVSWLSTDPADKVVKRRGVEDSDLMGRLEVVLVSNFSGVYL
jgi:hypothetical protein